MVQIGVLAANLVSGRPRESWSGMPTTDGGMVLRHFSQRLMLSSRPRPNGDGPMQSAQARPTLR